MTDEPFTITVQDVVDKAVLDGIGKPLNAFNTARAGEDGYSPIAILIRDRDDGEIIGALRPLILRVDVCQPVLHS